MTAAELLPDFREQFPEFDAMSDADVSKYLDNAILIHAICPMATVYLSSHLVTIDANTGIGGSGGSVDGGGIREVISEGAKSISSSFSKLAEDGSKDAFYTNTAYGRMYIVLRDACPGKKFSVRVA